MVIMTKTKPFIKKFKTEENYYIFDVNTNRILLVTESINDISDLYWHKSRDEIFQLLKEKHILEDLEIGYARVDEMATEHQLLSLKRPKKRKQPITEQEVELTLNNGTGQLTLEVTEACNLRCKYCVFSGGYENNRQHSSGKMSLSTGKRAIDFYFERNSSSSRRFTVGFYGGEPLLRFPLIRKLIEYAKSLRAEQSSPDRPLSFHLTTNATLLNDEIIDFFIENKVNTSISLDGPEHIHNFNRVTKKGAGSFKIVIENVEKIRRMDPTYFERHVLFNCVHTPASNLLELNEFFSDNPELVPKGINLNVSGVGTGNPTFFKNCKPYPTRDEDYYQLHKMYCNSHAQMAESNLTFTTALFEQSLLKIHKRPISRKPFARLDISPSCFPGSRKLFVAVDGSFHICERINNKFPIGNLISGFNIPRITEIMNDYASLMNANDCLNCEAVRFCDKCYALLAADGTLAQSLKDEACESTRNQMMFALHTYCYVWEKNEDAWQYMDDIVVG